MASTLINSAAYGRALDPAQVKIQPFILGDANFCTRVVSGLLIHTRLLRQGAVDGVLARSLF